jgi:anti-anti-sigma factor
MTVQQWNEDTLVVQLTDDPGLSEDMAEASNRLRSGACDVVLDMRDLDLLTSSGIAKFLRLRKHMIERHRRLILCSLNDRVWTVFLATGLDAIFEFAPTVTEALARMQGGKA